MTADVWADRAQVKSWAALSTLLYAVVREGCLQPQRGRFPGRTKQKTLVVVASELEGSGHCCDETQRQGTGRVGHKDAADMSWQEKAFSPGLTLFLGWMLSLGCLHG